MKVSPLLLKIFDFLSSVKLAVITLCSLAALLAIGTFYESLYDTKTAQVLIYHSPWMTTIMVLLIVNLTCAALDRFPWKRNHVGFVITHAGIITMLLGSFATQKKGIDASMGLGIGESSRFLFLEEPEVLIYESLPGDSYKPVARVDADYIYREARDINRKVQAGKQSLFIKRFHPRAERYLQIFPSKDEKTPPALEFQISNPNVNVQEWLSLEKGLNAQINLGPARVSFQPKRPAIPVQKSNELIFYLKGNELRYMVLTGRKNSVDEGKVDVKKSFATGWMGLHVTVHRFYPHSQAEMGYRDLDSEDEEKPAPGMTQAAPARLQNSGRTVKALEVQLGNEERWLELNSPQQIFFPDGSSYFIGYGFKKIDLGFGVQLTHFEVGRYGGTQSAASYTSQVKINGGPETTITMNEPAVYKNFTFYQASYDEDEQGRPTTSVFAVNYDPGRRVKYAGAIMMVVGMISMFYFKPRYSRKKRAS